MIAFLVIIFCLSGIFYSTFLLFCSYGLFKHRKFVKSYEDYFSIIIAAKNEKKHISELLFRLQVLNYKNFEVILIDDLSTDNTFEIMKQYCLNNNNFSAYRVADFIDNEKLNGFVGKKRALQLGIMKSQYEYLVFTDADCQPHNDWLKEVNLHLNSHIDFLVGYSPLIFKDDNILTRLKNFERTSMFALTAGSFGIKTPLTCTARNMIYRRSIFLKTNGFEKIKHIQSGDDDLMLLSQRKLIKNYSFMYSDESVVPSIEDKNFSSQIDQETRRTSKFIHYPVYVKLIVSNAMFFYISIVFMIFLSIKYHWVLKYLIMILLLKMFSEFTLVRLFHKKMKLKFDYIIYLLAESVYVIYFVIFGIKGTLGKYKWKS